MNPNKRLVILLLIVGIVCLGVGVYSLLPKHTTTISPTTSVANSDGNVEVSLLNPWTTTGISVSAGQVLTITATGRGVWKNVPANSPTAYPKPYEECGPPPVDKKDYFSNISDYQCQKANKGALIGKIGENGLPFLVGSSFNQPLSETGLLSLGINDLRPELGHQNWADNQGSFKAHITITNSSATHDEAEIVLTGKDPNGVRMGLLKPGESAVIKYLSGKIISNTKNGFTAPIWGVPLENTDPAWKPYMPYWNEGMWSNAVYAEMAGKRTPFRDGQYEITVQNTTNREQEIRLNFHEARGFYFDNEGDCKFRFTKR